MDPAQWMTPIAVNLFGVMNCIHAVLRPMADRGWGRIITISSYAGTKGTDIGTAHYGAAKSGSAGFMRNIALEAGPQGVTANTIALGLIREGEGPGFAKATAALPTRRRGSPDDVAALCLYLVSREAGWLTGQTINLDGGAFTS